MLMRFLEQDEEKGNGSAETEGKQTCPFTHLLKYSRPPAEVKQALTTSLPPTPNNSAKFIYIKLSLYRSLSLCLSLSALSLSLWGGVGGGAGGRR